MKIGEQLTRLSDDELLELLETLMTYINVRMIVSDSDCVFNINMDKRKGG